MKNSPQDLHPKERRLVTVLFADIAGFTALSEELDPEYLSESINVCFNILNRIITDYGGIIHKYEGDSVLAIFGLPQAHEDDPERGVKSALEMMERIPEINKALSAKLKKQCNIGLHAGVNLGTVFAGAIGSAEKKEYTIIGEAVNMASRLMDAAENGVILVSGRIFRQTRYLFDYEPLRPIKVKGISKPVQVFRPLGIKHKPDPKRGIEGLRSTMVGRDKEFDLLSSRIDALTGQKKGGAVFVMGEAGIGKTRLLEELKKYIEKITSPVLILEGRCLSYGEAITYSPILEILRQLFLITDQDPIDTIKDKIQEHTRELFPEIYGDIVPYLYYIFSIPIPAGMLDKVRHLDADGLKLQIQVALKDLLYEVSTQNPVLVVIEDYNWIDSVSLGLIKFIFEGAMEKPMLLLCLSRSIRGSEGDAVRKFLREKLSGAYSEIQLSVLGRDVSEELTKNLLNLSKIPADVHREIFRKAEGNPLYLEEIIRSLIDTGFFVNKKGMWKSTGDLQISGIPDSIQEIIATRLDFLEPDLKKLIQKIAVLGRSFMVSLLERLTGIDSLMMSVHLATLEELEYIRLYTKEPEIEYIFKHPMVHEVIYNSLPIKDRQELHKLIAEMIGNVYTERIDEFTELLAYHYSNSNDTEKAIDWLEKAGLRAKDRYANDEVILYFGKMISAIQQLLQINDHYRGLLLKAWENIGDTYTIRGNYDDALKAYKVMVDNSNDPVLSVRAMRKSARVRWHQADYELALEILDRALDSIPGDSSDESLERAEIYLLKAATLEIQGFHANAKREVDNALGAVDGMTMSDHIKRIKAIALKSLGGIYRNHGEYDKAINVYEQSRHLFEELNDKQDISNVNFLIGIIYHMIGEYKKAIELNEQSLAILEQIGDKKNIGGICTNLGVMYSYLNERDKSIDFHKKALNIGIEIGDKRGQTMAYSNIAIYYLTDNEYEKAHDYFQKNLKLAREIGDRVNISAALGNLAILFLHTGNYDKAEDYLLQAVKIIKELGNKQLLATAYIYIADTIRLKNGSMDEAINYLDQAWALASESGHKANMADCAHNYAKIYATMKNFDKSEEYINIASNLFTELGRVKVMEDAYRQYADVLESVGEKKLAKKYKL